MLHRGVDAVRFRATQQARPIYDTANAREPDMLIITGKIKVESEAELARVRAALIRRAERSRRDAGNIDYVFAQSLDDPTEIRLTETWDSEASLNAHLQIPDEEFATVIGTAKIERARIVAHEAVNERILMER